MEDLHWFNTSDAEDLKESLRTVLSDRSPKLKEKVEYYRIQWPAGQQHIAASSRDAVLRFLSSSFPDDLNTLERITEEEAKKAAYFDAFARSYGLCPDGTYLLGYSKEEPVLQQ
jgi:hypothetical protein